MTATPQIKFENSPVESLAESFDSVPGETYPSLFDSLDPTDSMNTPRSYDDEFGDSLDGDSHSGTPAPEKKPVKKRKSWGQQLPEPKTNLPPRKRAKTEDEKEQRRVERVLRNRRAAQSSRERKRQEVEALEAQKMVVERRNQDLEMRLAQMEAHNAVLLDEVKRLGGNSNMHFFQGSPASPDQIRSSPTPVTFSQPLFTSQEENSLPISTQPIHGSPPQTVNPASLSPEIRPVAESTNASSSDMTQHPAAVLCDLQCQSEEQRPWMDSTSTASAISQILATTFLVNMISGVTSTLLSPLSQIMLSLSNGSLLSPTTSILTLIIWLTTTTASLRTSTSTTSSTKTSKPRPRFTLRMRLLRRLLTCSPNLARPLMDATVAAMRSASEQQQFQACLSPAERTHRVKEGHPGIEVLTTLLWAIQCFEKEREMAQKLITDEMDASSEVRQACEDLSGLFNYREMRRPRRTRRFSSGVAVGTGMHGRGSGKGMDWRTEFKP